MQRTDTTHNQKHRKNKVHHILVHSYVVYLVSFLIGVCLDFIFKIKILGDSVIMPLGFICIIVSSAVILWAQKTGRDLRKVKDKKAEHFHRGPYMYTRFPTQFGLFFLVLGFGIFTNSFFVVVSTVVSFLISKFVFMGRHDKALEAKYGTHYMEYKKLVKF